MDKTFFIEWLLFPLIIFCSRAIDVSLGTLRSVLASKGMKKMVPFIGFFEVLFWLFAISTVMKNLSNFMCYLGWAGGYATGIYIGLSIEEKLAIGTQVIRVFSQQNTNKLIDALVESNYSYTILDGEGKKGAVKLIFIVVKRKDVKHVTDIIHQYSPQALYSIEDVKRAKGLATYNGETTPKTSGFFKGLLPFSK
ncbi:MAG: DUF2179 domain-containing protein [Bacteroidia bacterium]|nr:DUF2179 domain-containing protein [Bacteroidia bacterium]MCZ2249764.1 DUF2179 domain-containing protein [Bacteroidia bacterium]